ncbi:GNAT family N-acetyltransferase [Ideonella sp. A 288]|uniref:GNAT family N-acetyltransferase n=1 Tax=Ideonella sp. A 288 TaxID=1962181 RepID=UPI000B4AE895|nr:GNAT family N-acetyltransferase [Ideonella sp. A 288]
MEASNDVIRVVDDPTRVDAKAWNALLATQANPTTFMRAEYLAALHASGSATPATGWSPRFVLVHRQGRLVAAAPAYLKTHSYGEYVFDWSWAQAYQRHGHRYYPKLVVAVPFTPVPGTRLMAVDEAARQGLLRTLVAVAQDTRASSLHLLFPDDSEAVSIDRCGLMRRSGVQFHWTRDVATPARDFDEFLASLQRDKRKKISQERRRVREAGVTFSVHEGTEIGDDLWDFFYHCYRQTYLAHGGPPYLTRDFFHRMAESLPAQWLVFVAHRGDERIAASLLAIDRSRGVAHGRYWGCTTHVPCLHFEACYYQPLQWCIAQGFVRFEGGAQGEHKMARGLLPVPTQSAHWLAQPQFADAVAAFLREEGHGVAAYVDELREHSPFKAVD